jgi:hypothetical protein
MLWPARSPSRHATLSIESSDSFVASAAASIATGWSEPVPGRELHPLKSSAFSRRTVTPVGMIAFLVATDNSGLPTNRQFSTNNAISLTHRFIRASTGETDQIASEQVSDG